jgi:hypothetical protein
MKVGTYDLTWNEISGVLLQAPDEYWMLSEECKNSKGWDCGPGKTGSKFVPDTLYGLNVKEACRIHDCMYMLGITERDKEIADETFLENMIAIINKKSIFMLKGIRRYRATTYYSAVCDFGAGSFWKDKNKTAGVRG